MTRHLNKVPFLSSHNPSMFITLWDVKEPTHKSKRVGHGIPGVVVCPMWFSYLVELLV